MEKVENRTPHPINVANEKGDIVATIPPCGTVARVATRTTPTGATIYGRPVMATEEGSLEGLPEQSDGVVFIVSSIVLAAAVRAGRTDCIAPDTGPTCVRDGEGHIIAVRQWKSN